jgi:hypothetical protein
VTIPAGLSTATVVVTPVDDTADEADETVIATVATGTGYTVGSPSSATVSIVDNDPTMVSITASDASASETASGAAADTGEFTVTRTGDTSVALTVDYSVGGTAGSGTDYTALPVFVTIPVDASTATLVVTPIDDLTDELAPDETVIVTLTSAAGYTVGASGSATVNIADNDPTP